MKLKKIASLALAGIMAVSMLAGCKDGGNSNSGSSSENTNTASGYSAMLGEAVSDKVKDMDYVTFSDNDKDKTALATAVKNVGSKDVYNASSVGTLTPLGNTSAKAAFKDAAGLARDSILSGKVSIFKSVDPINQTVKVGEILYIDGSMDVATVMDFVAGKYNNALENLVDSETVTTNVGGSIVTMKVDYDYTISVSIVNVPATSNTTYIGSVNFIAVTVTRTPSQV